MEILVSNAVVNFLDSALSPSSKRSTEIIHEMRLRVLKFLKASSKRYDMIFTAGATAGLKLIGENFVWTKDTMFYYLRENHNSVLGLREYALLHGASFQSLSLDELELLKVNSNQYF
jgi:molybdenum cofactor sulfurtransferase